MKELELFYNNLRTLRNNPEITIKNYDNHINEFFRIVNVKNMDDIRKLKTVDIDEYKSELVKKGNKLSSIRTKISSIRSFFEFLYQRDYIKKNIITKQMTPIVMKSHKNIPSQQQFRDMLLKIDFSNKYGMKYYTIINLFISTGIRFSELANLKLDDFKDDTLRILGKGSKERIVILQDNMVELLEKYIHSYRLETELLSKEEFYEKSQSQLRYRQYKTYENYINRVNECKDLIFKSNTGIKLSTPNLDGYLKHLATKAGIDIKEKDISAHVLRHFYAIFNLDNNVPLDVIQENMGHSNISTTRIYAETYLERRREESKKSFWQF